MAFVRMHGTLHTDGLGPSPSPKYTLTGGWWAFSSLRLVGAWGRSCRQECLAQAVG